jgi:hypothetical protein
MCVEHDGMTFPLHSHGCITGLSIQRFFFSNQINDTAWKKKLLKSPRIGKKGREDSSFPFALNEKTVRPLEKVCPQEMIKKP